MLFNSIVVLASIGLSIAAPANHERSGDVERAIPAQAIEDWVRIADIRKRETEKFIVLPTIKRAETAWIAPPTAKRATEEYINSPTIKRADASWIAPPTAKRATEEYINSPTIKRADASWIAPPTAKRAEAKLDWVRIPVIKRSQSVE